MEQNERAQKIQSMIDELMETTRSINREASQPAWRQLAKTSLALAFAVGVIAVLALGLVFVLKLATSVV